MGAASAFGRIGAIASPMLVGWLYPIFGFGGVFAMTTGMLLMGALAVLLFGVRTQGRTLEDINEQAPEPTVPPDMTLKTDRR